MATEESFKLPDLGEGLADAELLHWHVAVGDTVTLNQVIAEVETAKAAVELPSPYAGQVLALHVAEGETVMVGTPIITFQLSGDHAQSETKAAEERVPVLVGYGATAGTSSRRNGRPRPALRGTPHSAPAVPPGGPTASPTPPAAVPAPTSPAPTSPAPSAAPRSPVPLAPARPLAKPLVRKLARDNGVDLTTVRGTGPDGIVTRQDLLDHLAGSAAPTPSAASSAASSAAPSVAPSVAPATDGEERIPIRGVRRATAQAMVRSAFTAPTVTEFITVDVTPTMDLLKRLRGSTYLDGVRLTMLAFVAKAMLSALRRNPTLNSSWDEEAQEIVLKRYVNLGIATATPRGLMVPNLKYVGDYDLISLARALEQLTETAREGRATPADLSGGTISITNVGVFGVDSGTPILNPGEAAILCLGAVREQPWVHEGQLAVRWVTTLSLSFDHRLVDGEQGSRFLSDIAATLATG
ncbi:MAG TPA: dihydrolipoamide acetyltransferase family protein [Kineosporiaceae bacterium]|nr:dihydrolipoamide acetyltransferase family protein [Kineosporiaceae bacterium]